MWCILSIYHTEKLCSISQLLCCVVYIEYLSHGEALFNVTVIVLCVYIEYLSHGEALFNITVIVLCVTGLNSASFSKLP